MCDCVNLEVLLAPFTAVCGDLQVVTKWTKLQKLDLQQCKAIIGDIGSFANLLDLKELSLYGCEEVEGDVESFQNLHKLCELKLRHCKNVKGDVSGGRSNFNHELTSILYDLFPNAKPLVLSSSYRA